VSNSHSIFSFTNQFVFTRDSYEERALSLDTVMIKHKHSTTYEDFISRVYSPIATPSPFCVVGSTSSGAGDGPACTGNPSMLAAALLDSHGHSHKPNQRSDSKFRGKNLLFVLLIHLISEYAFISTYALTVT
jgi:hypothetical protein